LRRIQRWSARLLRICGVTVAPAAPPPVSLHAMIVANHISWLDVFVLNACEPCRFIAKSEVRRWPVLGTLAARAGTIFIERANPRALGPVLRAVAGHLDDGTRVAYFPEGTSAAHGDLQPFHSALFEAACGAAVPVLPVALAYEDALGHIHRGAEYIGDTSFVDSVRCILSGPPIIARVQYLAPIATQGQHRRDLALASQQAVAVALAARTR
jgi:1-acyl-sn-glycerol-3-phosphate acyltransferase